jgi:superfamily II DNA or RNA helicase
MDKGIEAVFEHLKTVRSTLVVMATGTGKTELYLQVVERILHQNPGKRVLIIAGQEEQITQPAKRWRRNTGEWPAIEMGDLRSEIRGDCDLFDGARLDDRVVIATWQTLISGKRCNHCTADCQACAATGKVSQPCKECAETGHDQSGEDCVECKASGQVAVQCSECEGDGWICIANDCKLCFEHFIIRMQKFQPEDFCFLIIDEAHHSVAPSYARIIRYLRTGNPQLRILGPTATPDRADEQALGQVFESVAFEYNLPQPILDGWLTPIEQQLITVEGLNLANVRTLAGDLNEGDLEAVMMAEKVLHKITTPLIEIACSLEPGTIDRLVKENRLAELPGLCPTRQPTLVHAVSIAHAERMMEIVNRYLPGSAFCIVGTTPKGVRRDALKQFADGQFHFLFSCSVFLEGADLPNVSIIGGARPTKSRALQAQMLGRGLRPLPGLVDGVTTAEERVRLIQESSKPKLLAIDFVGNSGRHKLISSAHVLGGALPDELVERVVRKAAKAGQPVDILRALQKAKEDDERKRREQARRDAAKRAKEEEALRKGAAERRAGIVAGARYHAEEVNPFDALDLVPEREPAWHRGRMPTERMRNFLVRTGIEVTPEMTFWEAQRLIEDIQRRRRAGLCTCKQARILKKYGFSTEMSKEEATAAITNIKANGWRIDAKATPNAFVEQKLAEIQACTTHQNLNGIGQEVQAAKGALDPASFDRLVSAGKARRSSLPDPPPWPTHKSA